MERGLVILALRIFVVLEALILRLVILALRIFVVLEALIPLTKCRFLRKGGTEKSLKINSSTVQRFNGSTVQRFNGSTK